MNEQQRWEESDPETRGMSPAEQMKRPLGFHSKRQYRDASINGYQDAQYQDKRFIEEYQRVAAEFGSQDRDDTVRDANRGFSLTPSPDELDRLAAQQRAQEKRLKKLMEEAGNEPGD